MQERAEKNQTFVYVKVPEVPLRLSYKGEKEKNLEDLHDCSLVLPTLELHNRTCTWLDLLMVVKNTARKVLLSQVSEIVGKFELPNKVLSGPPDV